MRPATTAEAEPTRGEGASEADFVDKLELEPSVKSVSGMASCAGVEGSVNLRAEAGHRPDHLPACEVVSLRRICRPCRQ